MKQLVTCLLFLSTIPLSYSQTEAYFLGNYRSAGDLFRITLEGKDKGYGKALFFNDTVTESVVEKYDFFDPAYIPVPKNKGRYYPEDTIPEVLRSAIIPYEAHFIDSIMFHEEWITIVEYTYNGNEIRSLPSTVRKYISVEGIGKVYDCANLFMNRELMMICSSDTVDQKLLIEVYKYLSKTKNVWNNWAMCLKLAEQYTFATCAEEFSKLWLKSKDAIQLVSQKTEYLTDSIQYTVELKNISETGYFFPKDHKMAPAKRIRHFGRRTETLNLLDSDCGYPFQVQRQVYFINPGEIITLSFRFPIEAHVTETYEGIQFLSYNRFSYWILSEPLKKKGREYHHYPFRAIAGL